jgi:hypothetical protein
MHSTWPTCPRSQACKALTLATSWPGISVKQTDTCGNLAPGGEQGEHAPERAAGLAGRKVCSMMVCLRKGHNLLHIWHLVASRVSMRQSAPPALPRAKSAPEPCSSAAHRRARYTRAHLAPRAQDECYMVLALTVGWAANAGPDTRASCAVKRFLLRERPCTVGRSNVTGSMQACMTRPCSADGGSIISQAFSG